MYPILQSTRCPSPVALPPQVLSSITREHSLGGTRPYSWPLCVPVGHQLGKRTLPLDFPPPLQIIVQANSPAPINDTQQEGSFFRQRNKPLSILASETQMSEATVHFPALCHYGGRSRCGCGCRRHCRQYLGFGVVDETGITHPLVKAQARLKI